MKKRIEFLVENLKLDEHPEGGYYREIYRSPENIPRKALPDRYAGDRSFSTSIYYLVMGQYPSKFHRILSDEIWHFYEGSPVEVHIISPTGEYRVITMGNFTDQAPLYQVVIEQGSWFGGIVPDRKSYCLLGCTVAPGFDFADFEMAGRSAMLKAFPHCRDIIEILT